VTADDHHSTDQEKDQEAGGRHESTRTPAMINLPGA
jgi:hypothetical protein